MEPTTAACGNSCGERTASRDAALRIESIAPKPRRTASTRMNEPMSVSASCGRRSKIPVVVSRLIDVTTRRHDRPGWRNTPGTTLP
jgi:hypothetical protein